MATKLSQSRRQLTQTLRKHQQRISVRKSSKPAFEHPELVTQSPVQKHPLWHKLRWAVLAAVLAGITLIAFMTRVSVVPLSVAGIPVQSSTTQAELERQINDKIKDYHVTITYADDTTKNFNPADMGITVDAAQSAQNALDIKNPDNYFKRLRWWGHTDIPLVTTIDAATRDGFLQDKATQVTAPATDASISIDKGVVAATPAKVGEGYTLTDAPAVLLDTIQYLHTEPLKLTKQEIQPAITEGNIATPIEKIRTMLAQKVVFTINNQVVTAKPADIGAWIEMTPSPPNHTIDYTVNSGKVLSYMNAVAKPYIQPPVTQIVMPGASGDTVIVPGRNGVDITNKETMAADVAKQVLNGEAVNVTLPVQYATFKTITAQPHAKWLVVNTTTKRMYAYEQNNLVRTFLISAGAPQTPTVLGEYKIYSKYASQDMRGANADGSRYFQPNVKWVNYFYRDYAIHGNYWRPSSYFGNINSSHGCVGVPDAEAKWIYDWAPIGTTVIVHK
jgi:lipoprotein-anchoring transpeptidase ErfK/SrfK